MGGKAAPREMHIQMQYWKSKRDEWDGSGTGHYVICKWWSQKGIKMFQTNITPMHSAAVMHCAIICACLPMLYNKRGRVTGEQKVFVTVFGCVYCVSGSPLSLWFQSVTVSRDCECCSSPPSPGSSSTPALCSRHRAGQGFLSNWRQCEEIHVVSVFLRPSSSVFSTCSFHLKLKQSKQKLGKLTTSKRSCSCLHPALIYWTFSVNDNDIVNV